jgi:Holliday junction resolvase-like predicted endonuclease
MINVVKANRKLEPFSEEKIRKSVKRAGIPDELQSAVVEKVKHSVRDNISTDEIYNNVSTALEESAYPFSKSVYRLKQAIMELGPTGYPFEDFVSELLLTLGYTTSVRQLLTGTCVIHEVDVVAQKAGIKAMIEAKFHNSAGSQSDLHVSLYTKARFDDLKAKHQMTEAWLVTNTKASEDAIAFADCVGMKVISWDYPDGGSLRDLVEKAGLHPITMLSTLSSGQKTKLIDDHVVRCKTIHENPLLLNTLGLSEQEKQKVMAEINYICRNEHLA